MTSHRHSNLSKIPNNDESSSLDMFSIQLSKRSNNSDYQVDSVTVVQPNFKHRLTFSDRKLVGDVLAPQLSSYVETLLERIDMDTMVVSEPDCVLDLPNLVMGKMRMLVHSVKDIGQQVIIRFSFYVGGVQSAFSINTHFAVPTVTHREALAVAALHDICAPVFEVVASAVNGLYDDDLQQIFDLDKFQEHEELENDLLFYLELLKRYIVSTGDPARIASD